MTKKHFEELALQLALTRPTKKECYYQWMRDVSAIIDACVKLNPKFDADKFLDACLVKEIYK